MYQKGWKSVFLLWEKKKKQRWKEGGREWKDEGIKKG